MEDRRRGIDIVWSRISRRARYNQARGLAIVQRVVDIDNNMSESGPIQERYFKVWKKVFLSEIDKRQNQDAKKDCLIVVGK